MRDFFIESDVGALLVDGLVFAKESDISGPSCTAVRNLVIQRASRIKNVDVIYNADQTVKELKFSILNFVSIRDVITEIMSHLELMKD